MIPWTMRSALTTQLRTASSTVAKMPLVALAISAPSSVRSTSASMSTCPMTSFTSTLATTALRSTRSINDVEVDALEDLVDVDVLHQAVDVDALEQAVHVDPVDDDVQIDALEHGIDVDTVDDVVDVDAADDVVDVDVVDDGRHQRPDDGTDHAAGDAWTATDGLRPMAVGCHGGILSDGERPPDRGDREAVLQLGGRGRRDAGGGLSPRSRASSARRPHA